MIRSSGEMKGPGLKPALDAAVLGNYPAVEPNAAVLGGLACAVRRWKREEASVFMNTKCLLKTLLSRLASC